MTEIAGVDSSGGEGKGDKSADGNASFGDALRRFAVPLSIFGVALAIRLIYVVEARAADPLFNSLRLINDSRFYDFSARAVAAGELRPELPFFLGPLYSYAMGVVYAVTGPSLFAIKIAQCFLGAFSCVFLYAIGRRMFSEAVGIVAGVGLSVYGLHVFYSGAILPTIMVVFLNLLFLWLLVGAKDDRPGIHRHALAGVVLGLAAAAKPNALLLLPITVVALLWLGGRDGRRLASLRSLALSAGLVMVVAPFTAHNYAVSGEFILITSTAGLNFLKGNSEHANGTHISLPSDVPRTSITEYIAGRANPRIVVRENRMMKARALSWATANPIAATALLMKKFLLFLNGSELFIHDQFYFARRYSTLLSLPLLSFGVVAPIGLAGLAFALRDHRRSVHLYGMLLAQAASYTLVFVLARYRLVAVCCLLLLGAQLAVSCVRWRRTSGVRALLAPAAVSLVAAFVVNLSFPEFPRDRGFGHQWERIGDHYLAVDEHRAAIDAYQRSLEASWLIDDPSLRLRSIRGRIAIAERELRNNDEAPALCPGETC